MCVCHPQVLCDLETQRRRDKAKELMREAVKASPSKTEKIQHLTDQIEKELFDRRKHLIDQHYKRTVRKITFALKHNKEDHLTQLLNKSLSARSFVKIYI